jgi:alpha-1,2-mannosyltransferase
MDRATLPPWSRWMAALGIAAMAAAVLELLLFGVVGVKRNPDGPFDTMYYYAAGRALLARQNPYDSPTLRAHGQGQLDDKVARFYYPPQVAPLFMLLGLFSYRGATLLLKLLNIAAIAGVCALALRMIRPATTPDPPNARAAIPWLLPAMIVGDYWFVDMVWGGGIVPVATLCLMGGWLLAERGRPILAGVLLGLATIKPQFALLPLIWLACERQWKALASSAATVLVCLAYPMAVLGPRGAFEGWFGVLRLHQEEWCNALGWRHLMGIANLLYAFGLTIPDLTLAAVLLTVALWFFRRRFRRDDVLAILTAMSVTLLSAHDYDIVVLAPLLVAYWRHLAERPREAAVALALSGLLLLPDPIVAKIPTPWVYQRCTVGVLILLAWLLRLSWRGPEESGVPKEIPAAGT